MSLHHSSPIILATPLLAELLSVSDSGLRKPGKHLIRPCWSEWYWQYKIPFG